MHGGGEAGGLYIVVQVRVVVVMMVVVVQEGKARQGRVSVCGKSILKMNDESITR